MWSLVEELLGQRRHRAEQHWSRASLAFLASAALAHALSRLGLRSSSTSLVLYFQPVPAQLSKERHIIVCLGTPLEYKLQFLGQFLDNKKQVRKCVFLDGYFGGGRLIFRRRKLFA